jgi:hypothetical protein
MAGMRDDPRLSRLKASLHGLIGPPLLKRPCRLILRTLCDPDAFKAHRRDIAI